MIGLLMLGLLALYLRFTVFLARAVARLRWPAGAPFKTGAVFVVLVLLPFADELIGRAQFHLACRALPGPHFTQAFTTAQELHWDYGRTRRVQRVALIPMEEITGYAADTQTGAVVFEHTTLFTPGGWVMQLGLNMGDTSSCNQVNTAALFEQRGFVMTQDGHWVRAVSR